MGVLSNYELLKQVPIKTHFIIFKYGRQQVLHKALYSAIGFETNCGLKAPDPFAMLADSIEKAGKFDEVCPVCFPNGIEDEAK